MGLSATAQNIPIGNWVAGISINSCSYTSSAKNLCTLQGASGSMAGICYCGTYNYGVLKKLTLTAEGGFDSYAAGAAGYEAGVGSEYDFKISHRRDPFDIYLNVIGGYTHINYKGNLITISGKFVAPGIFYAAGLGIRKYISHHAGLFVDANYALYHYSGGEVITQDNQKTPYMLNFSGYNFGGGIYVIFGPKHTTPME